MVRRAAHWFALWILRPVTAVLRWFGLWPRLLSRGLARMHQDFGPYKPNEHDVLVCSYFKSGTNWSMQIALQIAYQGAAEFEHIHDLVPWPEIPKNVKFAVDVENVALYNNSPSGHKVIKTHLLLSQLPWSETAKYLCVVRDPKDVFVSSYHFILAVLLGPLMPTPEEWLELFLSADAPLGSWAEHLDGFWQLRDRANVLFLTFDEMKADTAGVIGRVAELLDVDLDPDQQQAVLHRSSFSYMKSNSRKFDPIGMGTPWANQRGSMLRRGQSGVASELLSADQARRIDEYWAGQLQRLGSDFPYRERFVR
jgi:hypothetical protein